jgi:hypothetical protein
MEAGASSPPRHGTVEVPKDGGGVAAALSGKDLKIVDAAVFWPLQTDPLCRLTGVFPFPSSDTGWSESTSGTPDKADVPSRRPLRSPAA